MIQLKYHWPPIIKDWETCYLQNPNLTMAAYARANNLPESTFQKTVRRFQNRGLLPFHVPPIKPRNCVSHINLGVSNLTLVIEVRNNA
ncbi:hypothetical protein CWC15_19595 [Pseudoalteromonas spongiae]|nr:hypothetical protein CWC15_19595 [Pseudoalteromonas spongiae]